MSEHQKKKSYFLMDWVIFVILMGIQFFLNSYFKPHERLFRLDDPSISYPYHETTDIINYLYISCSLIPYTIILIAPLFKKNVKYNCHQSILGLFLSNITAKLLVSIIKYMVGRYRPDFISLCDVDFQKVEEQYNRYRNITTNEDFGPRNLFDTSICKAPREVIIEEQQSFPSGHSTCAFSMMSFLALYIAGQIHLMNKKRVWKYFTAGLPLVLALVVALSRVMDYKHHWEDVTVGSLIGIFCGIIFYFNYYPSLRDPKCDIPRHLQKKEKEEEPTTKPKPMEPMEIIF